MVLHGTTEVASFRPNSVAMSQRGSAMLGSGSQSCQVMAKTDNAQSIVNILSAIHLKRDIVRSALPFHPDAVARTAQARTAVHSAAPPRRTTAPSAAPKRRPRFS